MSENKERVQSFNDIYRNPEFDSLIDKSCSKCRIYQPYYKFNYNTKKWKILKLMCSNCEKKCLELLQM